ncbi:MAG: hypothetical protein QNJ51_23155 [Calothrix sp. MO_167.B12]|nr:hypothetical protein [Calothrix sp. MO_167.B12]
MAMGIFLLRDQIPKVKNPTVTALCELLDAEKANDKPIRLVRSRIAIKPVKLLFVKLTVFGKGNILQ